MNNGAEMRYCCENVMVISDQVIGQDVSSRNTAVFRRWHMSVNAAWRGLSGRMGMRGWVFKKAIVWSDITGRYLSSPDQPSHLVISSPCQLLDSRVLVGTALAP